MFQTLKNAFKSKDIRKKLFYTFFVLLIIRLGSQLPTPGVDGNYIKNFFEQAAGSDVLNFFDAFTGGSFSEMSIFALSITPYITASIIMQLLTIAIPKLEEMQKEGEDGRKKIATITRYVTVILALIESSSMAIGFGQQGLLIKFNFINCLIVILTLTAGSAFLMWIGEQITEKGVGNGISIVLLINIISRVPQDLTSLFDQFVKIDSTRTLAKGALAGLIIIAVIVLTVVFVIILQDAERRIQVQYSKKLVGRKTYGGQETYIPLKVNTAGVIPIIFAQSIMQFPVLICTFFNKGTNTFAYKMLSSNNWLNPNDMIYSIGLVIYMLLVVFFAYFYTSITFNPHEIAENMRKSGGFIPGIRPGKSTSDYLQGILNYIIFIGAVGLIIVQLIPYFFNGVFNASVSFGGTSLIIIVGVVLETLKQIESQMLVRNYKGFLND